MIPRIRLNTWDNDQETEDPIHASNLFMDLFNTIIFKFFTAPPPMEHESTVSISTVYLTSGTYLAKHPDCQKGVGSVKCAPTGNTEEG